MVTLPTGRSGRVLALVLLLLALASVWQALGAPLMDWYADRAATIAQREALVQRMAQVAAGLPALQAASASPAAAPQPQGLLPGGSDAVAGAALQEAVQGMAAQAGAMLGSTEALPAEPAGTFRRISVRVALSTPWPALVRLLRAMAEATPGMLVDDLQLHSARRLGPGESPMEATLTVFSFRPNTDKAAGDR